MIYSETLWARIDRSGRYRTELYGTRREAIADPAFATDAKWAVVRVRVTEIRKSRSKGGKTKGKTK